MMRALVLLIVIMFCGCAAAIPFIPAALQVAQMGYDAYVTKAKSTPDPEVKKAMEVVDKSLDTLGKEAVNPDPTPKDKARAQAALVQAETAKAIIEIKSAPK